MNIRQLNEFIYLHQIAFHKKRLTREFGSEVKYNHKKTQNKIVLGDHLNVFADFFGNQIEFILRVFFLLI